MFIRKKYNMQFKAIILEESNIAYKDKKTGEPKTLPLVLVSVEGKVCKMIRDGGVSLASKIGKGPVDLTVSLSTDKFLNPVMRVVS